MAEESLHPCFLSDTSHDALTGAATGLLEEGGNSLRPYRQQRPMGTNKLPRGPRGFNNLTWP